MKKGIFWGIWFVLTLILAACIVLPRNFDPSYDVLNKTDYSWVWGIVIAVTLAQVLLFGVTFGENYQYYGVALVAWFAIVYASVFVFSSLMYGLAAPIAHASMSPIVDSGSNLAGIIATVMVAVEAKDRFKPVRRQRTKKAVKK